MKRSRIRNATFILLVALLLALAIYPAVTASGQDSGVQDAWERVQKAGSYRFLSSIDQTLIPRPIPEMLGEQEQRLNLTTKGAVRLPDQAYLEMWAQDGATQTPPMVLIHDGNQTFLQQDGKIAPVENPAGAVAPTGDWLGYLVAARNVQTIEPAPDDGVGLIGFRFDIDGPRLAEYVRQQMEGALRQEPNAPAGLSLAPSPLLSQLSGQGELWVGADGLPRRQVLDLNLPEATSQYDARLHVVVDLSDFGQVESLPRTVRDENGGWIVQSVEPAPPGAPSGLSGLAAVNAPVRAALSYLGVFCLCLFVLFAVAELYRRRPRHTYASIAIAVLVIMVITPLLDSVQAAEFFEGQTEAALARASAVSDLARALGLEIEPGPAEADPGGEPAPASTPVTPAEHVSDPPHIFLPLLPATIQTTRANQPEGVDIEGSLIEACGDGDPTQDFDQDGLNDQAEGCLGTDPYADDSDGDGLSDWVEIEGFEYPDGSGKTWTSNPLSLDSNHDGIDDASEWPDSFDGGLATDPDLDGDGVPSLWDDDNDDDGVPDSLDLSPEAATGVYADAMDLAVEQDPTFGGYQYIDFQVRPVISDHLRYTTTALDWPYDEQGNMQDPDNSIDDIRLSPALLVATNVRPGRDLEARYGFQVWPSEGGDGFDLLAPLYPVGEGGAIQAFQGKVAYGPEAADSGAIHWQARLVWLAQAQAGGTTKVLARYEDDFRLTGLQISKSQNYEFALFATPETPQEDGDLLRLQIGLKQTFLKYQELEYQQSYQTALEHIAYRFEYASSFPPTYTWGVSSTVEVRYAAVDHRDAGLSELGEEAAALLDTYYASNACVALNGEPATCGSLLLAFQEEFGLHDLSQAPAMNSLSFNVADITPILMRGSRLAMYEYHYLDGWQVMAPSRVLEMVEARYAAQYETLAEQAAPTLGVQDMRLSTYTAYLGALAGALGLIETGGVPLVPQIGNEAALMETLASIGSGYWSAFTLPEVAALFFASAREKWMQKGWAARWLIDVPQAVVGVAGLALAAINLGCTATETCDEALAIVNQAFSWVAVTAAVMAVFEAVRGLQGLQGSLAELKNTFKSAATYFAILLGLVAIGLIWISYGLLVSKTESAMAQHVALISAIVNTIWIACLTILALIPGVNVLSAVLGLGDALLIALTGGEWSMSRIFYEGRLLTKPGGHSIEHWASGARTGSGDGDGYLVADRSYFIEATHKGSLEMAGRGFHDTEDLLQRSKVKGEMIPEMAGIPGATSTAKNFDEPCTVASRERRTECANTIGSEWGPLPAGVNHELGFDVETTYQYLYGEYTWGFFRVNTRTETTTTVTIDDERVVVDVLPATIDELWAWAPEANHTFNPDLDGDGLYNVQPMAAGYANLPKEFGLDGTCDDPTGKHCTHVAHWDTDLDGLSDSFELEAGTDPLLPDTDWDGLSDGLEFGLGTYPTNRDSDLDGLEDGLEAYHHKVFDWDPAGGNIGDWVGGWQVSLPGGQQVWVYPDPLMANSDGDAYANDAAERLNQASPYAVNPGPILRLDVQPFGWGGNGRKGVYVGPGDELTVRLRLFNGLAEPIDDTLSLCLPIFLDTTAIASENGGLPEAGACDGGMEYYWALGEQPLQPMDMISATLTALVKHPGQTPEGDVSAALPLDSGTLADQTTVKVDLDEPEVSFDVTLDGAILSGESLVIGRTAADPTSWIDHVELDLPGYTGPAEGTSPWLFTWELPSTDGDYSLCARAYDHVGNWQEAWVGVTVDNTPPEVTVTTPDSVRCASGAVQLEGTAGDATSGLARVQISINGQPWRSVPLGDNGTWSYDWQVGASAQGGHSVRVRAVDLAGNISEPLERTIVVDQAPPSDALADSTYLHAPPAAAVGQPYTLTGVADEGGYLPRPSHPALQALQGGQAVSGSLDVFDDANVWLGLSTILDDDQGAQAAWLGDFNNDRMADLAVGLPAAAEGAGQVIVVYGRAGDWPAPPDLEMLADSGTSLTGEEDAGLGSIVAAAGDVNGDSLSDLLVGETNSDRAFLVFGRSYPLGPRSLTGPEPDLGVLLQAPDPITGLAAAGDTNDDGLDDLLVTSGGQIYLVLGRSAHFETLDVEVAGSLWEGDLPTSSPGDVDGDGTQDQLTVADGEACLILGEGGNCAVTIQGVAAAAEAPYAAGADVNADGSSDLLLIPSREAAEARGFDYGEASVISTNTLPRAAAGTAPPSGKPALAMAASMEALPAADTFYVDDDHPTCGDNDPCYDSIQTAVDAADDAGDTIVVGPGVYLPFDIGPGKDHLTVRGLDADAVFVDGGGTAAYAIQISHSVGVSLTQMTLRNAERGAWLEEAGALGYEIPANRTTMDHLLIHGCDHALYMDRKSTAVVRHSTLAGLSQEQAIVYVDEQQDTDVLPAWEALEPVPQPIAEGGALVQAGDTFYALPGGGSNAVYQYDQNGQWIPASPAPSNIIGSSAAAGDPQGRLWLLSAGSTSEPSRLDVYDGDSWQSRTPPSASVWEKARMVSAGPYRLSLLLNDGRLLEYGKEGLYDTPGRALDVALADGYAYVADEYSGLQVVDVRDPSAPKEAGSLDLGDYAEGVAVAGDYAYVAASWLGLVVVDITNPYAPTLAGVLDTTGAAVGVAVAGGYAYVADISGLSVVNVSDPFTPTQAAFVAMPGYAADVAVAGGYAYVADEEGGLRVVDVSTPDAPEERGVLDTPKRPFGVAVAGGYAYVADMFSGLWVVDVSTPDFPVERGFLDTPGIAYGVAVAGDYAYVADAEFGLRVVDVSDPDNPTEVGAYDTLGTARRVAVTGDYAYVADSPGGSYDDPGGLVVLDVSHPSPSLPWRQLAPAESLSISDAYVADPYDGLYVLDISDPEAPITVGACDTPGNPTALTVDGNHAYLAAGPSGLQVVDISDPANPTLAGSYDTPSNAEDVAVAGDTAYVADGWSGFQVVDVVDPTNPTLLRTRGTVGYSWGVAVDGVTVYLADDDAGLSLWDVEDPADPTYLGYYDCDSAEDVAVAGDYAYVADGVYGLRVVDVSDPTQPTHTGSLYIQNPEDVAVAGDYAYVADLLYGLRVVDVSDPSEPAQVGSWQMPITPRSTEGVAVSGEYAYVAVWHDGLRVVDISNPTQPTGVGFQDLSTARGVALASLRDDFALAWAGGALYEVHKRQLHRYDPGSDHWTRLADLPEDGRAGWGATMAPDRDTDPQFLYVMPGGGSNTLLRYSIADDQWATIPPEPPDSQYWFDVHDGYGLALMDDYLHLYASPTAAPSNFYRYGNLTPAGTKLAFEGTAFVAPSGDGVNWSNLNPASAPPDFQIELAAGNAWVADGAVSPAVQPAWGDEMGLADARFLDPALGAYRVGAGSQLGAGYYAYHDDAYVYPSRTACQLCDSGALIWGETAFEGIQAAVDSGATRVLVRPGVYPGPVHLVSGVEVLGAGAELSVVEASEGLSGPLVRGEGVAAATVANLTLAGNGDTVGFHLEDGALGVRLTRDLVRDQATGVEVDGASLEVVNNTIVDNIDGLRLLDGAPLDVRNTIFAFNTGTGLDYEDAQAVSITYNDFWANGQDLVPAATGDGNIFLDPLLVSPQAHNYRLGEWSPAIDAGDRGDEAPPGTGKAVDMGYREYGRASYYADVAYGPNQLNDGLTWGVDAFDTIGDALATAAGDIPVLAGGSSELLHLSVGVGPGTYHETVSVPSYVHLVGSGADETTIDAADAGSPVTFDGVVQAEVSGFKLTGSGAGGAGVVVMGASNTISVSRNLIVDNVGDGVRFAGRSSGSVFFNTIAGNGGTGLLSTGNYTQLEAENNIVVSNAVGLQSIEEGLVPNRYNLVSGNGQDFAGLEPGEGTVLEAPAFGAAYNLSVNSPALDAASPFAPVPPGGGLQADMGYKELLASPLVVFFGPEIQSTVTANSGVAGVEVGVTPVDPELAPSLPLTETLPANWYAATLRNPNAPYSLWTYAVTPGDTTTYRVYSRASDTLGNLETDETVWYAGAFVGDDTPPSVTWVTPTDPVTTEAAALELAAQASDYVDDGQGLRFNVAQVYFDVNGQAFPAEWADEFSWQPSSGLPRTFRAWVPLEPGSYTVQAVAVDGAGHSSQSVERYITVDPADPPDVSTVTSHADGQAVSETELELAGYVRFGSAGGDRDVTVQVGSSPAVAATLANPAALISAWWATVTLPAIDGDHQVTVRVNSTESDSVTLELDRNPPALDVHTPQQGDYVNWTVVVEATASDSESGLVAVQVSMDGGYTWRTAGLVGDTWQLTWDLTGWQDFVSHPAVVRAVDMAGNETRLALPVTVDNQPPTGMDPVTFSPEPGSYIDAGMDLEIEWEPATDASGQVTVLLDVDQAPETEPSQEVQGTDYSTQLSGAGQWYVHLAAQDAAGNQILRHYGPWHVDEMQLDGYVDTTHEEWLSATEMLDDDERSSETQSLFATWDSQAVYLGLQEAWWPSDGTLWAYLGPSASSTPRVDGLGDVPLAATYAVEVVDSDTGRLWVRSGGSWTEQPLEFAHSSKGDTEVRLPWSGSAYLIAFVLGRNGTPRSVFPTTNPLTGPWTEVYGWTSLSLPPAPNAGQPQAESVALSISSPQEGHAHWGPGEMLTYHIKVHNHEASPLSNLELSLNATSGLGYQELYSGAECYSCPPGGQDWDLTIPYLAAKSDLIVTVSGQLASDLASLNDVTTTAVIPKSNLAPARYSHRVDGQPPTVEINVPPGNVVGPDLQLVSGTAEDGDGSGVALVEVLLPGQDWQPANGTMIWTSEAAVSAGADSLTLVARAIDAAGNTSAEVSHTFDVDGTAPELSFSVPPLLAGDYVGLRGAASDVGSRVLRVEVQLDRQNSLWLPVSGPFAPDPSGFQSWVFIWNLPIEDGVAHNLRARAVDVAGNEAVSAWLPTVVDTVAPAVTVETVLEGGLLSDYLAANPNRDPEPFVSGSVSDGSSLSAVSARIDMPNGVQVIAPAELEGTAFSITPAFDEPVPGEYRYYVEATDVAGNLTVVGPFTFTALNTPPEAVDDAYSTDEDTLLVVEAPGVLGNDSDADGDPLTVGTVQSSPDNLGQAITLTSGGLVTVTASGELTYDPNGQFEYLGTGAQAIEILTYANHDSIELSLSAATVQITVLGVNDPPQAEAGGPYSADEGQSLTLDASGSSDVDDDELTFGWDLDSDGDYDDASGVTADVAFDDNGSYTALLQVTDPSGESATDTAEITINNVAPAVAAQPVEQEVDFSDAIADLTFTATDVAADTLTAAASWSTDGITFIEGLPELLVLSEDGYSVSGSSSSCTWTVSGIAAVPAGVYTVRLTVEDGDGGVTNSDATIMVAPEDASVRFHAGNPVAVRVAEEGGDSGFFELEVRVRETYPDSVPEGSTPYPGEIGLGQVSLKLVPVGPGGEASGDCTVVGVFDEGYDAFQRVVCSFDAVPVNTYLASATVDGAYYAGYGEDVLVVYDPSLGFATGGGWFDWPGTEERTSFGFTMEYNKSGSNVKGSMLLIRHSTDGSTYQVKSNALYGLSLGVEVQNEETFGWASFSGKATYLEPGWPEPIGNHEFLVYVEDRNEPGSGPDRFWIEVYDKGDNVIDVMSMVRPAIDHAEPLTEGNIFVPH